LVFQLYVFTPSFCINFLHAQSELHVHLLIVISLIGGHNISAIASVFQDPCYNKDVSIPPSYSQCPDRKSQSGHRPSYLRVFAVFLIPSRQFHYTPVPFRHPQSPQHWTLHNHIRLKHHYISTSLS